MDQISRRQVVQGAAAAATAAALHAPSVHAQKDRQALNFAAEAALRVLDPIWSTAYITRNHEWVSLGSKEGGWCLCRWSRLHSPLPL